MNAYKIRINVEIVPTAECPNATPVHRDDGSVELEIPESEASSIDRCERRLLDTTHPVIRDALAHHLSALSKKSPRPGDRGHDTREGVSILGRRRGRTF